MGHLIMQFYSSLYLILNLKHKLIQGNSVAVLNWRPCDLIMEVLCDIKNAYLGICLKSKYLDI